MTADYCGHKLTDHLHGLGSPASAHKLRHFFATRVYRAPTT